MRTANKDGVSGRKRRSGSGDRLCRGRGLWHLHLELDLRRMLASISVCRNRKWLREIRYQLPEIFLLNVWGVSG